MALKYELDLRDYIRILKKRKYTIMFSAVVMGVFSFVFARMQEPTPIYQASAGLKIEKNTNMTGLYIESLSIGEGDNLETQAKIIKSYPIIEKVAKKIGKLDPSLTSQEIRQNNDLLNKVLDLKSQVETERDGFTNLINITATSTEPKFAQKLANTVAGVYKEENTKEKNKRADDAVNFIRNQLKVVKSKLTKAEERLKGYRENHKLISLDAQSSITLNELTRKESALKKLESAKKEIQTMVHSLEKRTALSSEAIEGGIFADQTSPSFMRLNDQLTNLRVSMDTLLLVYTEKHPEVMEIKEQIEKISANMLKELHAQLKTMEKRKNELAADLKKLHTDFRNLPQSGLTLARLERDVKLQGETYALLEQKYQEALIRQAEKVEEVVIVKPALEPSDPINPPNTGTTAFLGVILGMTLGLIFSFISETLDTSIGTIEDVEEFIGVPVIGIIPFVSEEEIKDVLLKKADTNQDEEILARHARLVSHFAPHSTLAESYRTLRTNIQFASLQKKDKVLLMSSSSPKEGKSTTTANLAMTMAQAGLRTIMIDADMRKPMVNKIFGLEREPGLSDILLENYEFEESVRTVTDIMMGKMGMENIMKTPGIDNLHIITSGVIPPNPSELLNSSRMQEFIDTVRERYDVVIFDTTPILPATDAAVLGSKVDAVILVYKAGQVARGALKRAKVQMDNVNANVLGVVLNALKSEVSSDFQDYRYYTYYSYGSEGEAEPETLGERLSLLAKRGMEKFEEYTSGMRSRVVITGISIALMLGGLMMSDWQFFPSEDNLLIAESRSGKIPGGLLADAGNKKERKSVVIAGTPGPGETRPQGGVSPEKGPAGNVQESPPKGGPPSGPVLSSPSVPTGEKPSFWEKQSFLVGSALTLLILALGFAVRWYLLSKDEEETGGEEKTPEEEKEPFAGVKHVDLSLDIPEAASRQTPSSGVPDAEIPSGVSSSGVSPPGVPEASSDAMIADFSLPEINAPQQEVPGMDDSTPVSEEGELPDFKFTLPGMDDTGASETPALDLPSATPEVSAPQLPGPEPRETAPTDETLIDSSFHGFAEHEDFGEIGGEELPDFSEFKKIDFSEKTKEDKSPLEEIQAVPQPEGGALESFPQEETSMAVEEDSAQEQEAGAESRRTSKAITWDTTPLPEVEKPGEGLASFAAEAGEETTAEESAASDSIPPPAGEASANEEMELPGELVTESEEITPPEIPKDLKVEHEPSQDILQGEVLTGEAPANEEMELPGELVTEIRETGESPLPEEAEPASIEMFLTEPEGTMRSEKLTRTSIEEKIARKMMEEGEDVNRLLNLWQKRQKEEIDVHFKKKDSIRQLKNELVILEKKIAFAKQFKPEAKLLQDNMVQHFSRSRGLYKQKQRLRKDLLQLNPDKN